MRNKNKCPDVFDNRRRLLITSAALSALTWVGTVLAQVKPPVVIGWLNPGSRESNVRELKAFKEGLAAHGWKEGAQYVIEGRWLSGRMDQLPRLAQELAARKPQVIVASPSTPAAAAAKAAPHTPVVQVGGSPLESGNVASLARPGGMITGLSSMPQDLNAKVVELLRETVPKARRVGFLCDPKTSNYAMALDSARRAVKQLSLEARFGEVTTPAQLEPVISRLAMEGAQALIVLPNVWFSAERDRIVKVALMHRLPVATGAGNDAYAEAGALLVYGPDILVLYRRAAYYADRILKGTKPADLPVEQPTTFELVVNMKTAKMLGITFPQTILVRATRVIE